MARVRLFASVREAAERSDDELHAANLKELVAEATKRYGSEFEMALGYCRIAVNGVVVNLERASETELVDDDEVAFLPPVSGG